MIIKIGILGVCVSVISVVMKNYYKEAVLPLELVFGTIVILFIADKLRATVEKLHEYFGTTQTEEELFSVLIKGALICIVTKFAADTAKDSGNGLVADVIDFSGRVLLIAVGFPFFESALTTALAFLS